MPTLEVMICTIGPDALMRLDLSCYPASENVCYTIGWQLPGDNPHIPESISLRKDIKILFAPSCGLSVNRNYLLSQSSSPLLLVSDDDVEYKKEDFGKIIDAFRQRPGSSLLTFARYSDATECIPTSNEAKHIAEKSFPEHEFSLTGKPKGYYVSSIEIAFRRADIAGKIKFDERFGLGADFPFGEEEIFVNECVRNKLYCRYLPIKIVRHDGVSSRNTNSIADAQTKGAVISMLHPYTWTLRMLAHAIREYGKSPLSAIKYCKEWIKGIIRLHS